MSLVFSFKPGITATMLHLNHAQHGNYSLMRYSINVIIWKKKLKIKYLRKNHKQNNILTHYFQYEAKGRGIVDSEHAQEI